MGIPIKPYLVRQKIERGVMKAFLQMFRTNYQNVRVQKWEPNTVAVADLIDLNEEGWLRDMVESFEVFDIYKHEGRKSIQFPALYWWSHEYANAPADNKEGFTRRRLDELLDLYDSIKKNGYVKKSGNLLKVLDIRDLTRKEVPKWKSRVTPKYYRLNGKRRLIICKYLGIKEIIVSVVKVKIVKL